jgi:calcium-dependent protein kinase
MELEKVFCQLDTSGDGFLTRDELLEGYRSLYGSDFNSKEVDKLIEMADLNGDGKLSYNEWLMTAQKQDAFLNERKLDIIFAEFDVDGTNTISLAEV